MGVMYVSRMKRKLRSSITSFTFLYASDPSLLFIVFVCGIRNYEYAVIITVMPFIFVRMGRMAVEWKQS